MRSIIIPLEYIDKVIDSISKETYTVGLPLSKIDRDIINIIAKTQEMRNIMSHVITKENYEDGTPFRKWSKMFLGMYDKVSSY
jgi:hypothetical protein